MTRRKLTTLLWIAALAVAAPTLSWAQAQTKAGAKPATARATFAGGCFWCMEEVYDKVPGVISTVSGYMGGHLKSPTYEQVSAGRTGHAEVVQVEYDPAQVSYAKLLEVFGSAITSLPCADRSVAVWRRAASAHGDVTSTGARAHDTERIRCALNLRASPL
jgi:hypothetical protein